MDFTGKKICFLGDSITEGSGTSGKGHIYCDLVGEAFGATVKNYGIGGTRIAPQHTPSDNPRCDLDFCMRMRDLDADADCVVVFGGTNDFGHGDAPFGTENDRTPETFIGALHTFYSSLLEKYPATPIVVMTPIHREQEDCPRGDGSKKVDMPLLVDYVNAIRKVAEMYSIPVLDLYAAGGMQPKHPAQKAALCPDGLHPNDAGHEIMARKLVAFLKSI